MKYYKIKRHQTMDQTKNNNILKKENMGNLKFISLNNGSFVFPNQFFF